MSYDDGRIALTDDELVIRMYYFPFGDKRLRYSDIAEVRSEPLRIGLLNGRWRIWGSGDFVHWYNFDPGRPRKDTALVIDQTGRSSKPVITPDNPQEVIAELASHGVTVTTG
jgi:hypothetical protein